MSDAAPPSADSRWRLILNGKSAGNDEVRESVMALRKRGVELDVRVTWEAGDAERYVAEALDDGIAVLIAGGGDGTLNAIAGALARHDAGAAGRPSLALLPLGTGNDFATAAQVPTDADEALRLVQRSPARTVDLLRIEADGHEHWCANLASGGFGTQVTVETDEGLKKVLGGLAYLITGIARLGRIEPVRARFSGPGFEWQGGFIALGIGNARQAGGGQVLCPDAVIDDDLLDVTIVPELDQPIGMTVASVLTEGKQRALDRIAVRRRLPWVEIEAPQPFTLNLDGEPVRATRFHVDCVAHCLRMHLPPGCPLLRMSGNPLPASGEPPVSRPENAL